MRDAEVDPAFLHYYLSNPAVIEWIYGHAVGATMPNLNTSILRSIPITYPTRDLQRCISGILSTYDGLIENNTRRIAILEEMAQAIYRQWFVNFRFPGHEQLEMVESKMGPVPAGWEVVPLSAVASHVRHNIQPGQHPKEVFAHFSIPAFDAGRRPALEQGGTISSTKHVVEQGTVLISKLNPRIPRAWLPFLPSQYRSICSTEFLVLTPKDISRTFLFGILSSSDLLGRMSTRAGGTSTSHQRVKPNDLLNMRIMRPAQEHVRAFTGVAAPTHELAESLRRKNAVLRRSRDLLLPRLISGEIDVAALEDELAGAA